MLGIGFVCLLVGSIIFGTALSVICGTYVWPLGLSVFWLGDLCLALHLSVICGTYIGHWVCLLVG